MDKLLPFRVRGCDDEPTHVMMSPPYGRYRIPRSEDVISILKSTRQSNANIGLCELSDSARNHVTHFDLDISLKERKSDITIDDFIPFVKCVNTVFNKYLTVSKDCIRCFVLSKQEFSVNVEFKNQSRLHFGLHVIYPDVIIPGTVRQQLYDEILADAQKKRVFSSLPILSDRYRELIEFPMTSPVMCYGANKPDKSSYEPRYVVEYNLDVTPVAADEYSFEELFDKFRFNTDAPASGLKDSVRIRTKTKCIIDERDTATPSPAPGAIHKEVDKLVAMLDKERCTDYHKWIQVGLCLYNISSDDAMLATYIRFSEQESEKSRTTDFAKLWSRFKKKVSGPCLKIGTLRYWAEMDSPGKFRAFRNEQIDDKISVTINDDGSTHHDIALVIYSLYGEKYVCVSVANNMWYEFKTHRWMQIDSGFSLFNSISTELVDYYRKRIKEMRKREVELDDMSEDLHSRDILQTREFLLQKKKNIEKIIQNLKTTNFKKNLMMECRNMFFKPDFLDSLDEVSRHLLCFSNGVYDLDASEFRDGMPSDLISFCTNIEYVPFYECENTPELNMVWSILNDMHKSGDHTEYLLATLAAALHGKKKNQRMDIWTGVGSNGKSLTVELLQKTFGDYFYSPSIQLLTTKRRNSSNASPDIMKIKGKRILVFQEPENDDQIYTGLMKAIFGNDNITGRLLHQNESSFKPQASGFLACNDLPTIVSQDGGTWRRIRVLDFPYKFVMGEPKPNTNEKRGNPNLSNELGDLAQAFMSILIKKYRVMMDTRGGIIVEPPDVMVSTKSYRSSCDLYEEFLEEYVQSSELASDRLDFKDLHTAIQAWNREYYKGRSLPKRADIKKQMEAKLGRLVDNKHWPNTRLTYNF
jgi:P4 family phage/plasmid primase-like protien